MRHQIIFFHGTVLLMAHALAAEPIPFQVKGHGVHSGNNVVYRYRVINNSPTNVANPIRTGRVEIGRQSLEGEPELTGIPPIGYPPVYDNGVLEITSPTGWKGYESGEQEHVQHTIVWETVDVPYSAYKLLPSQTLTGLSVMRAEANATYLNSHFAVYTGWTGVFSGHIEREDTTPPALTLTVNPPVLWPPNNKLIPVSVTVVAKDDYDPQPEIKLESITANETLGTDDIVDAALGTDNRTFSLKAARAGTNQRGRIYTITYSATDGSGNKATAPIVVTVPHDKQQ